MSAIDRLQQFRREMGTHRNERDKVRTSKAPVATDYYLNRNRGTLEVQVHRIPSELRDTVLTRLEQGIEKLVEHCAADLEDKLREAAAKEARAVLAELEPKQRDAAGDAP